MKNFRIDLCYDGSRYKGWQRLGKGENTIQAKLEQTLSRLLEEDIEVSGSGRTDAGVHAEGQVANFHSNTTLAPAEICALLRRYLPDDIGVLAVSQVDDRFHSRLNAVEKTYRYRIWNEESPCVFQRKFVWNMPQTLDISRMEQAASYFLGSHDFMAFCANKHFKKSSVRTLRELRITQEGGEVVFTLKGDGFLYHMVRIIVGTLVEVGLGQREADEIPQIFASRKRENAGATAPANGLCLVEVQYP